MKVHRVPLCFAAAPPSIAIKGVHRCLYFSLFIELVKSGSQCSAIIIISFKKDMEILKMMRITLKDHKKAKVNTSTSTSSEEMESSQEEEEHILGFHVTSSKF